MSPGPSGILRRIFAVLLVAALPAGVSAAHAADGPIQVSVGLSSTSLGGCCLETTGSFPLGWYGDVGLRLNNWFSLMAETGADYETVRAEVPAGFPSLPVTNYRTYSLLAGPRFWIPAGQNLSVFAQVLFGSTYQNTALNDPVVGNVTSAVTSFAWQPSGGIQLGLAKHLGMSVAGGYRLTPLEGGSATGRSVRAQFRFAGGLVVRP